MKRLPVDLITGTEFLRANDCTINYGKRLIILNNKHVVLILNNKKSTDEILDDELCEKISLLAVDEDKLLDNKILKYYFLNNHKRSCISKPSVDFRIKENIPEVHHKGYCISVKYLERGRHETQRLLQENIIEQSKSPYASSAFFIKKKNNDLRLVVNYQTINKYIHEDPWILPKNDECLTDMRKNEFFSQLDLQNGFNQLRISESSRKYTAFMLFGQQYQYKRLPFGI